jgi:hypothetical protein
MNTGDSEKNTADNTATAKGEADLDSEIIGLALKRLSPEERAKLGPVGGHEVRVGEQYQLRSKKLPRDIQGDDETPIVVEVTSVNGLTAIVYFLRLGPKAVQGIPLTCFGGTGSGALYTPYTGSLAEVSGPRTTLPGKPRGR